MASCCDWKYSCSSCVSQSRVWFTAKELPGKYCCCTQPSDTGLTIADYADGISIPCPPDINQGGMGVRLIASIVVGVMLLIIAGLISLGYKRGWRVRFPRRGDQQPLLTRYQNNDVYGNEMVELVL